MQAYKSMKQKGHVLQKWEEDTFSINLYKHIMPLASQHPLGLNVKPQVPVITKEIERGEVSLKEANKIDIQLWVGNWGNHDRVYFAWEGKLITDKHRDKSHSYLISKYLTEGLVDRFIDGKYSNEVDDAGMLGYVLAGEVVNIVRDINESMHARQRIRRLQKSDHLQIADPFEDFIDVYQSSHHRPFCGRDIHLYHLFLTFDFEQNV